MNTKTLRGFTLYELMVTLLVAGIIFGLGIPNLLEFSRNNQMSSAANDMITSILLARSEAVKRRVPVTLCASPNPVDASPTCSPDASGTSGGYIVWADDDADAVVDGGEDLLVQRDDPQDITVFGDNGYVHFGINGFLANIGGLGDSATNLLFCDARGNVIASGSLSAARAIRIDPTGRGTVMREVADVATIVTALGAACP
jgi:type IV fimbrial biogenesis protein FimT